NGSPETEIASDTDEDEADTETEDDTEEDPVDETDEDEAADADTDSDTETETDEGDEEADTEDEPEEEVEEETDTEEEPEEDIEEETDDETAEEDTVDTNINADAPLNESYNINFGDGSADRNAIAQYASSVSGINQGDMITWWVGNNGPGRAFTVVSDSGRNTVYRVYLQYGEGEWHVTSAEELDGVPSQYR
ncbi:MAG: DUF1510 family protein, partial [Alkalibacterium sp.]